MTKDMCHHATPNPFVSVIMTNFNYARYLSTAIDAYLAQDYPYFELIVVDDGSTDCSRDVLASYGDRIRIVLKPNGGQCSALNAGFEVAQGEVICFADSDDSVYPDKLSTIVEILKRYPRIAWVQHRFEAADENLQPLGVLIPSFPHRGHICPRSVELLERVFYFMTPALAVRRHVAQELMPLPETDGEPGDWWVKVVRNNPDVYFTAAVSDRNACGYLLDRPLGLYRRHRPLGENGGIRDIVTGARNADQAASRIWSDVNGIKGVSTNAYKHELVVLTMSGHRALSVPRRRAFKCGLGQTLRLWRVSLRLAMRQTIGLMTAFFVPALWIRRFSRRHGHDTPP